MNAIAGPSRRTAQSTPSGRPVITYRHLLSSQAMTVNNPLRVVAHCDIDAAYAQFEMVRLNLPEDQPVCVQQWSGLIAVNYPARKFGITRHMDVNEAKKRCPHLQTVHVATFRPGDVEPGYWGEVDSKTHKVSLDPYRRESQKIIAVFKEMVTEGEVEKASIDEAFLDLTALTLREILFRHPHLSNVPPDAPHGIDTALPPPPPISWSAAGNIFPVKGEKGDKSDEDGNGQEDEDSGEEEVGGWEDYALCCGAELMAKIRAEVHKRLGYTCSAGVAHNKTLAKLCSGWKKPNAQTILRQAAVPAFLNPWPFTKIRFLGGKLGGAMASEYGAGTVGDMLTVPLDEMQSKFGEESIWVWNILRGIDLTEVKERTAVKSMLASKNIQPSVTTREGGYHWLTILAGELYVRLRDAREITEGLWPKTLVLGTRQGFESSRSRQTAFPFTRNLTTEYIAKYAHKLWDEVTEPMTRSTGNPSAGMKFNNLALSFNNLERLEGGQKGIEGFFAPGASATKTTRRDRSTSVEPSGKRRKIHDREPVSLLDEDEKERDSKQDPSTSWQCPRCQKTLRVNFQVVGESHLEEQAAELRLQGLRQEHEDYHFARDLHLEERSSNGNTGSASASTSSRPVKSVKVKGKAPDGIKAFFTAKPKDSS